MSVDIRSHATFYEQSQRAFPIHGSWRDSLLARKLGAALKTLQYAQMVSVMNRMPDTCLAQAGLSRSDIPEQARRCVYGDSARQAG